jgi:hypothetical protein
LEDEAFRLFAQSHEVLRPLAAQFSLIKDRDRAITGSGFITSFLFDDDALPIDFRDEYLFAGVMTGECEEMPLFFLDFQLEDGFLSRIDGNANGGLWKLASSPRLTVHDIPPYEYLAPYITQGRA